jgi:hypothetical protein
MILRPNPVQVLRTDPQSVVPIVICELPFLSRVLMAGCPEHAHFY